MFEFMKKEYIQYIYNVYIIYLIEYTNISFKVNLIAIIIFQINNER